MERPNGSVVFHLPAPLKPGQIVYATDGCLDTLLIGPAVVAPAPAAVALLSPRALALLVSVLGGVGLWGRAALDSGGVSQV